jgi:hypothetical protein
VFFVKFTKLFSPALFFVLVFSCPGFCQSLGVDEIVTRHLESIGKKEDRDAVRNVVLISDVEVVVKGSQPAIRGKAVIAASGEKSVWGLKLDSVDYAQETFAFNGKEIRVANIRPGVRSTLGGLIYTNHEVLKDGLLGGSLISSWTMLRPDRHGAKLLPAGTKKVGGNDAYVIEYLVKGGSDLTIKLFFDAKTFRHVRSEYTRFIAARQGGSVDSSAGQTPIRYEWIEEFSDFRSAGGLTIPKTYKLKHRYSGNSLGASIQASRNADIEMEWIFTVTNHSKNQDLSPEAFDIDVK